MADRAYLDEHRAYIGSSGSGKSTTARGDVEELLRQKRHTAIIDHTGIWYGLRSDRAGTGPGFDIPVFGGRRGDVAIGAGDGEAIGRIVGDGVSAIVDLSALRTGAEQRIFMQGFIASIRSKPAGHFQLVNDEADEDIPEKGGIQDDTHFRLVEDMIWIAKRGRSDGFVLSMITQRPADVAKAALSQAQTFFAHQLTIAADINAFGALVKRQGTKQDYDELMARMPTLKVGERYLYRPRARILELGESPLPTTFDSSRTPGPGESRREPKMLSQIDVSAIAAALKKPTGATAREIATGIPDRSLPLLAAKTARNLELEDALSVAATRAALAEGRVAVVEDGLRRIGAAIAALLEEPPHTGIDHAGAAGDGRAPLARSPDAGEGEAPASGKRHGKSASSATSSASQGDADQVRGRKALAALVVCRYGLTEQQWAWVAGFSRKGGTWGTYKSALTRAGLVREIDGKWWPSDTADAVFGTEELGPFHAPGPELARFWGKKISGVARVVEALIERYPAFTIRANLADVLNMAADGGTFGTYISRLRSAGMIEVEGKKLRLNPTLMGLAE
ncbi:MAG TPA: hypothetical protein VF680_01270 [Allosphingosinicella sp.]|jgi:hypothetical protein